MELNPDVLSLIEREAEGLGIKPETLCKRALNDSQLPRRLRAGGSVTVRKYVRLLEYLGEVKQ